MIFAVTPLPPDANLGVSGTSALRIVFADLHADLTAINRELRSRHLGVQLQFLPTPPSLVDKPIGASVGADFPEDRLVYDYPTGLTNPDDAVAVTVPGDVRGVMLIFLGRRAMPGENYASTPIGGAEAPGEALHCHPVTGLRAGQAVARFAAARVTPIWRLDTGGVVQGALRADTANLFVVAADLLNDHEAAVELSARRPDPRRDDDLVRLSTPCADAASGLRRAGVPQGSRRGLRRPE